MEKEPTLAGYPIGKVAQMIRRELYSGMTDNEAEAINVIDLPPLPRSSF